jgi:hypothetical protein
MCHTEPPVSVSKYSSDGGLKQGLLIRRTSILSEIERDVIQFDDNTAETGPAMGKPSNISDSCSDEKINYNSRFRKLAEQTRWLYRELRWSVGNRIRCKSINCTAAHPLDSSDSFIASKFRTCTMAATTVLAVGGGASYSFTSHIPVWSAPIPVRLCQHVVRSNQWKVTVRSRCPSTMSASSFISQ